jgi:ATP-dependent RNA helicase RhlE
MKKKKLDGDGFHENQKKRIKSQSCGPGVTKKKTHGSVNRNMLKTRDKEKR